MLNFLLGLSLAAFLLYTGRKLIRDLHMMQQNSYMNSRYSRWLKSHYKRNIFAVDFLPLLSLLILSIGERGVIWSVVVLLACYIFLFCQYDPPQEKKKLVFTNRAKRLYIAANLISILLALVAVILFYIRMRFYSIVLFTATSTFTFVLMMIANLIMQPLERSINNSFYKDTQRMIREMPNLKVIGLTGSFGKTSTKFILGRMLSEKFNTLITPDSYNTPMGITKVIRTMLKPSHEIFVAEMGAKQKGDIRELCELANPSIGILTAIGEQHLETFGNLQNIIDTKFELIDFLPADGIAILNLDDENIRSHLNKVTVPIVSYGMEQENLDYIAYDVQVTAKGSVFKVKNKAGQEQVFTTKLLGRHNIHNILAAIAAAGVMGVSMEMAAKAVKTLEPVPHRLSWQRTPQNIVVIDDAFNSNPVGSQIALEVLAKIPGNKKIIVTPGMVELGEKEELLNKDFAQSAAVVCDYIILVGKKHSRPLQEGLEAVSFPQERLFVAQNLEEANGKIREITEPGDVILFENDLPDTYNE